MGARASKATTPVNLNNSIDHGNRNVEDESQRKKAELLEALKAKAAEKKARDEERQSNVFSDTAGSEFKGFHDFTLIPFTNGDGFMKGTASDHDGVGHPYDDAEEAFEATSTVATPQQAPDNLDVRMITDLAALLTLPVVQNWEFVKDLSSAASPLPCGKAALPRDSTIVLWRPPVSHLDEADQSHAAIRFEN